MAVHVFTSCSYSYLNRARVLGQSLRKFHPDWKFWLVMIDKEPPGFAFDLGREDYDFLLTAEQLFGPELNQWLFEHDVIEACTAVKGRAACHILERSDCDKLIFLDADTAVFNSLSPLISILDSHSIVLTPHQVCAESADNRHSILDNEVASLHHGVFNLGFLALKNDAEAKRFAQFWKARLDQWCYDRLDIGLFVDQKWCNLVPCFFDNVKILRDPGYNVASWNLNHRRLNFDGKGRAMVNGHLLRFYHFTKLGPVGDVMTQRYAKDNVEIYELWWWYRQAVKAASEELIPATWWHYGSFENGVPIPKPVRELYRSRVDLQAAFPNPYQTTGNSFFSWLCAHTSHFPGQALNAG